MSIQSVVILYGGELSTDVAKQIETKASAVFATSNDRTVKLVPMSSSKDIKSLAADTTPATLVVFVASTIENEAPPEDAGACIRFFKRRTHAADLLAGKFQFAVMGLGDSNLLLDRQHTGAADCNQVAQILDGRLEALGGTRYYERGEADERTGLMEVVEPWIDGLITKVKSA